MQFFIKKIAEPPFTCKVCWYWPRCKAYTVLHLPTPKKSADEKHEAKVPAACTADNRPFRHCTNVADESVVGAGLADDDVASSCAATTACADARAAIVDDVGAGCACRGASVAGADVGGAECAASDMIGGEDFACEKFAAVGGSFAGVLRCQAGGVERVAESWTESAASSACADSRSTADEVTVCATVAEGVVSLNAAAGDDASTAACVRDEAGKERRY